MSKTAGPVASRGHSARKAGPDRHGVAHDDDRVAGTRSRVWRDVIVHDNNCKPRSKMCTAHNRSSALRQPHGTCWRLSYPLPGLDRRGMSHADNRRVETHSKVHPEATVLMISRTNPLSPRSDTVVRADLGWTRGRDRKLGYLARQYHTRGPL